MTEQYEIIEVNPDWVLGPENTEYMGSKEKFWHNSPFGDNHREWLFKYPRPNSGEHWAEKIAAEVAEHLEIPHARVELAEFQGIRGSTSELFLEERELLFHGNELLEVVISGYDPEKRFRQSNHTLANIWLVLEDSEVFQIQFAEYLLLDAIIGNTDRHHENWGVLVEQTPWGADWRLAPSFDHASSLGRELPEERRERFLREGRVGSYSERATGGIYWSEEDRNGLALYNW